MSMTLYTMNGRCTGQRVRSTGQCVLIMYFQYIYAPICFQPHVIGEYISDSTHMNSQQVL